MADIHKFHNIARGGNMGIDPITLGIAAIAIGGFTAFSASKNRDAGKRAAGQAKDQQGLQKQIREEAKAAPGLADEEARKATLKRRRTIARQGTTLLTGVDSQLPGEGGKKTLLGL